MRHLKLFLICFLFAAPALAQQFGQWSWQANVRAGGRSYENTSQGQVLSQYQEQVLVLGFNLNGFLVHPAIARFNLGLDLVFSRYPKGMAVDNNRTGFSLRLGLLPESAYPLELFASRSRFDYQGLADLPAFTFAGTPEQTTSWGGRLRFRHGLLAGALLGFDASTIRFLEGSKTQDEKRAFFDWSGSGQRLQHHLRLDHQDRSYGVLGLRYRDVTATWDSHGNLTPTTRWDLSLSGLQREFGRGGSSYVQSSLRQNLTHQTPSSWVLSAFYAGGFAQSEGSEASVTHDLSLRAQRSFTGGFDLGIDVGAARQQAGDYSTQVPRLGLTASYQTQGKLGQLALSAATALGRLTQEGPDQRATSSYASTSAGLTLRSGSPQVLQGELELAYAKNKLRQAAEDVGPQPEPQALLALGTEDNRRARLTLRRNLGAVQLSAFSDWWQRETTPTWNLPRLESKTLTHTLQAGFPVGNLAINVGQSQYFAVRKQELAYFSGVLSLRPFHFLGLTLSHRQDRRRLPGEPWLDSERQEAAMTGYLGAYQLQLRLYWLEDRWNLGAPRKDRGLTWTVSRSMGGWLPIIAAPVRRGVIR